MIFYQTEAFYRIQNNQFLQFNQEFSNFLKLKKLVFIGKISLALDHM